MEFVPEGYPKYPKIETCFNRDKKFKVDENSIRLPEINNIKRWLVTEKIDGTSGRVIYDPNVDKVFYGGRTDKSDRNSYERLGIAKLLEEKFTLEKMREVFPDRVVTIFMEYYGEKINSSGNLRKGVSFRVFDVQVEDLWLEWESVKDIASKFGVKTVPEYGVVSFEEAVEIAKTCTSIVAQEEIGRDDVPAEGIVCRTVPLLLQRNGKRLMFKLKKKDY
ncbi:MAG: RNA ligase family protein [Candidatus Thorarchaeota archaeon]